MNFAAWGANCGLGAGVEPALWLARGGVRFFTQFATAPSDVSPQALAVIEAGMARGVEAYRIVRAARMLQGYELMFWDTLYVLSTEEVRPAHDG